MKYLILIDMDPWRDASSLEHAGLLLRDLKPQVSTEVLSGDGLEWYKWNPQKLELEKQEDSYVLRSISEQGYWSNSLGWAYSANDATRFTLEQLKEISLPLSAGNDAQAILVSGPLPDFVAED